MDAEFWHERWQDGRIGFHQDVYNAQLVDHWQHLGLAIGSTVFVPLAGKSRDMVWLADQGHKVLGVELNGEAVEAFLAENDPVSPNIDLRCGDFFALTPEDLASVNAVYDRASLIALPPEMRARYAQHMIACLPPKAQIFLVTLEYPQPEMDGPPFSVSEAEVRQLYGDPYEIERISCVDVPSEGRPPSGQDLSEMLSKAYRMTPR